MNIWVGKFHSSLLFLCPPICSACTLPVILVRCTPEDSLAQAGKAEPSESQNPRELCMKHEGWKSLPIPAECAIHCPIPPVTPLPQSVLGGAFPPCPARSFARNWNLLTPSFPAKTAALGLAWQMRVGRKSSKTLSCPQLCA